MPDWAKHLIDYGVLGIFTIFVFLIAIPAIWRQLFSRDEKKLGLAVMKIRSSVAKDEKMCEFVDKLSEREDDQQKLCEMHAANLYSLSTILADHHSLSEERTRDLGKFKRAALEGCGMCRAWAAAFPEQQSMITGHVDEMERIIREQGDH